MHYFTIMVAIWDSFRDNVSCIKVNFSMLQSAVINEEDRHAVPLSHKILLQKEKKEVLVHLLASFSLTLNV